jgi:hypothetical protein
MKEAAKFVGRPNVGINYICETRDLASSKLLETLTLPDWFYSTYKNGTLACTKSVALPYKVIILHLTSRLFFKNVTFFVTFFRLGACALRK